MNRAGDPDWVSKVGEELKPEPLKPPGGPRRSEKFNAEAFPLKPYSCVDPASIPRRQWLYPKTYIRGYLTATIAPPGAGKTGQVEVEALAMVTGRDLLSDGFRGPPLRVWFWSEDPIDELTRQLEAIKLHYNISDADIGGRLIVTSARDLPLCLGRMKKGELVLDADALARVGAVIDCNKIDVASFDHLKALHKIPENSSEFIDDIAVELGTIADTAQAAVSFTMHTRKPPQGMRQAITIDDARGSTAIIARTRIARVLNTMTPREAEEAGIEGKYANRSYFRIGNDRMSMSPPEDDDSWRFMKAVRLPNGPTEFEGDSVRVVVKWNYPDAMQGVRPDHVEEMQRRVSDPEAQANPWRADSRAEHWAGHLVGEIVDFDPTTEAGRKRAATILKIWTDSRALREEKLKCPNRKNHPCIVHGI